jgi:DNA-binding CsgD family transcriptional regulator/transcriptional regulator with XRE-family HTH domain
MDQEAVSFAGLIGGRLRGLRDRYGWSQDDVAQAARWAGLGWARHTVAAIEGDSRDVSAGELLALPLVLRFAALKTGRGPEQPLTVLDLFPDDDTSMVEIARGLSLDVRTLRGLITGDALRDEARLPAKSSTPREGEREAERSAALALGARVSDVQEAAERIWGRTVTEERERRLGERELGDPAMTAARRRTLRGRITRQLKDELDPVIRTSGHDLPTTTVIGPPRSPEDELTSREREILGMVAFGKSTAEIAEHFKISAEDVKTVLQAIKAKLNAAVGDAIVARTAAETRAELLKMGFSEDQIEEALAGLSGEPGDTQQAQREKQDSGRREN